MLRPEIKVQDSFTGKKDVFRPITEGRANIYVCGPTVYSYTHVGNARAALSGDLVARILRYAGFEVKLARNVTDVDDKIIKAANAQERAPAELAEEFTRIYLEEMDRLESEADLLPRATGHMDEIIKLAQTLIEKDLAYTAETPFGTDVYFRVKSFPAYGSLSKRKIDDLVVGARIEPGEMKQDPLDFALWKAAKPGEPSWGSPWGEGRPGWHIECSAMISKCFPEGLDIHMGGLDLIFPHHENEIAQSEGATGKKLARYWMHNGMLTLGSEKMSKSIGNIFTTHKFLEDFGPETLRLLIVQAHYRSPSEFSDEVVQRTEGLLERLYHAKAKVKEAGEGDASSTLVELKNLKADFDAALFDDFGTAKALGLVLKAIRACFKDSKPENWRAFGAILGPVYTALGLTGQEPEVALEAIATRRLKRMGVTKEFSKKVDDRLKEREAARAAKDFATSDRVRKELELEGIMVMDGPDGSTWSVRPKA